MSDSQKNVSVGIILPLAAINIIGFIAIAFFMSDNESLPAILWSLGILLTLQTGALFAILNAKISNRVSVLSGFVDDIASTERTPTEKIDDDNQDKLSHATHTLVHFINDLRNVLTEIRKDANEVTEGSEVLFQKMTSSTQVVESRMHEISHIAEEIDGIAKTSHSLTNLADQVNQTSQKIIDLLARGGQASDSNSKAVEDLVNDVISMSETINELQSESAKIGTVLSVIRGIADQTNLLALNAAIEAARAGEQGRGFAVVADEVRALAHRTQESTIEIQSIVEGLQDKSQQAAEAMEHGRKLSDNSLEQSQQVVAAISEVRDVVAEAERMINQISEGTVEQNNATDSINERIREMAEMGQQVIASLSEVSGQAQSQQQTAAEVNSVLNRICV